MAKKNYYMVLDVETANSIQDNLVYDIGYVVTDRDGNIYEKASYVVSDIYYHERDLMVSAYYANKLPLYEEGIVNKMFRVKTIDQIKFEIRDMIAKYDIKEVGAYNANFDIRGLNNTERYVTASKYRYFLPYGVKIFCIWHMACQVICTKTSYIKWCLANGFVSDKGNILTTAECVYSYISKNRDFVESHTGLDDTLIETQIMKVCYKAHKKMNKNINGLCWRIPQKKAKEIKKVSK